MILARTLYDLHMSTLPQTAGTFKRLCMPNSPPPPLYPQFYTRRKMRPKAKKTQLDGENSEMTGSLMFFLEFLLSLVLYQPPHNIKIVLNYNMLFSIYKMHYLSQWTRENVSRSRGSNQKTLKKTSLGHYITQIFLEQMGMDDRKWEFPTEVK